MFYPDWGGRLMQGRDTGSGIVRSDLKSNNTP